MRYWFDTEFYENGQTIALISIGIVAEDGREFYAETSGAETLCHSSRWLMMNVRPYLTGNVLPRSLLVPKIIEFMGENPEIWGYYADYDWVVFCQLFGRMIDLPETYPRYCRDVKQLADSMGNPPLPQQETPPHNALNDARWTKQAWEFLTNAKNA